MLKDEIEDAQRLVKTDAYQLSIGEIVSMYRNGELVINPDFQRLFRWDLFLPPVALSLRSAISRSISPALISARVRISAAWGAVRAGAPGRWATFTTIAFGCGVIRKLATKDRPRFGGGRSLEYDGIIDEMLRGQIAHVHCHFRRVDANTGRAGDTSIGG
jgi:hypothetical protein